VLVKIKQSNAADASSDLLLHLQDEIGMNGLAMALSAENQEEAMLRDCLLLVIEGELKDLSMGCYAKDRQLQRE
jgi:hypothetical protein